MPSKKSSSKSGKAKKPCAKCKKKGKKCSGDCGCSGGADKGKMDGALTPQEYLDACDLGIQRRSPAYIRARLDARKSKGRGVKCGNGYISPGEQCGSGSGSTVSVKKKRKKPSTSPNNAFTEYQRRQQAANRANLAGSFMGSGPAGARIARNLVTDAALKTPIKLKGLWARK